VASLTDRACAEIKRRIITLAYRPGQFLNESSICTALRLGRTPVHEALHRLRLEGLVEIIPRKGILIRPDSLNDVIALLEARAIVEPQGIGLAAERITPAHLDALEGLLIEGRQAVSDASMGDFMALDARFHQELARSCGNVVLAEVMRLLHERSSRIWHLQVWSGDDLRVTQCEHEEIVAAIRRGSKDAASTAAAAHLSSLKRRILSGVA
jgi:GntR family transcriptional regulator, rspAB operon transcriptional repressor